MNDKEKLIYEFFKEFMCFESALSKEYAKTDKNGSIIGINWEKVSPNISISSGISCYLQDAQRYYLKNPPKKRFLKDGLIEWCDVPVEGSNVCQLLIYLARVRNNLFHGSKCEFMEKSKWQRSKDLLQHVLCLIKYFGIQEPLRSNFCAASEMLLNY